MWLWGDVKPVASLCLAALRRHGEGVLFAADLAPSGVAVRAAVADLDSPPCAGVVRPDGYVTAAEAAISSVPPPPNSVRIIGSY